MPYHRPIPGRKDSDTVGGLRMFAEAEKLMHIAFVLPSAVFIGWLLGAWAGSKLHQGWMMIAGILLGCVSGLVYVIRMAFAAERDAARADQANAEEEKREKGRESAGGGTDTFKS
jgi:F0F1-type ATP synthase assembly protein I